MVYYISYSLHLAKGYDSKKFLQRVHFGILYRRKSYQSEASAIGLISTFRIVTGK